MTIAAFFVGLFVGIPLGAAGMFLLHGDMAAAEDSQRVDLGSVDVLEAQRRAKQKWTGR
jgi:hypothetical protein